MKTEQKDPRPITLDRMMVNRIQERIDQTNDPAEKRNALLDALFFTATRSDAIRLWYYQNFEKYLISRRASTFADSADFTRPLAEILADAEEAAGKWNDPTGHPF